VENLFKNFSQYLSETSPLAYLVSFLGGVWASFTPCIYPMIPVLVGVIGSQAEGSRVRGFRLSLTFVVGMALTYSLLGLAAAFYAAVTLLDEYVLDEKQVHDDGASLLGHLLLLQGMRNFLSLFDPSSEFWKLHDNVWSQYVRDHEQHRRPYEQERVPLSMSGWSKIGRRWALSKIPILACAVLGKRAEFIPVIQSVGDELNTLYQVGQDILNQVRGVGFLKPGAPSPVVQEGRIQIDESIPGLGIVAAPKALQ